MLTNAGLMLQVVVGAGHKVAKHSRISLCQQAETSSSLSDDELEYAAAGSTAQSQAPLSSKARAVANMDTEADELSGSSDDDGTQYEPANGSTLEKPQPEVLAAARAVSARDERHPGVPNYICSHPNLFNAHLCSARCVQSYRICATKPLHDMWKF